MFLPSRIQKHKPCIIELFIFDQHVDIDRPKIRPIRIRKQKTVIHRLGSFQITVFEFQLGKFIHNVNVYTIKKIWA